MFNNSIELTGEHLSGFPDISAGQLIQDVRQLKNKENL